MHWKLPISWTCSAFFKMFFSYSWFCYCDNVEHWNMLRCANFNPLARTSRPDWVMSDRFVNDLLCVSSSAELFFFWVHVLLVLLWHPKDCTPKHKKTKLVYAVRNVGETKQPLYKHMAQHRRANSNWKIRDTHSMTTTYIFWIGKTFLWQNMYIRMFVDQRLCMIVIYDI